MTEKNTIQTNEISAYYAPKVKDGIEALSREFGVEIPKFISNAGISASIFEKAWSKCNLPQLKHILIIADHYNVTLDEILDRRLR